MKSFFAGIIFFLLSAAAANALEHVIITQVLYDPLNTDSGGEAVQLYNPTATDIDIGGWVIATETSPTDTTIPEGTILSAGSYYLIADAGWSENKDDANWQDANHEEAITLANTDAGVALINNGTTIDAVGWGDASGIGAGLYEGTPAANALEGQSLRRKKAGNEFVDSDNNLEDFTNATPSFQSAVSQSTSNEIIIYAVITSSSPIIELINVTTDDDETTAGIQVSPVPKQNKTVNVRAIITDSNGYSDIISVVMLVDSQEYALKRLQNINPTTDVYEGSFNMSFYDLAGNYTINVSATDTANTTATSSEAFEYLGLISMELDTSTLSFAATPGSSAEITGDLDVSSSDSVTIQNTGNAVVNVQVSGTNLTTATHVIDVSNIQYTFSGGDYSSELAGTLAYEKQTKNINLQPGATAFKELSFRLNVPVATMPGNYSGKVSITAVS